MIVRVLKRVGLGFLFGMAVGNLIAYFTGSGSGLPVAPDLITAVGNEAAALLIQTVLSGLIGAAGFGGTLFYEKEKWSMLRAMLTHFALISVVFVIVSKVLCWITAVKELLIMEGIMLAAYLIIWLIMCAIYRSQVKELNAMLKSAKDKEVDE